MTAVVTGKKLKAGVYRMVLDAKGRQINPTDWVVPLSGYDAVRGPYAQVTELTGGGVVQVDWRGLALGEPTWADPAALVVVPKPTWAL